MTQVLIKRRLSSLKPGDVVERRNGEQCTLQAITEVFSKKGGKTILYWFSGFVVAYPVMRQMFDLSGDWAYPESYTPSTTLSCADIDDYD